MYRLLVTGARDLPEVQTVWVPLWVLLHYQKAMIVTYGKNPKGADLYCQQWLEMPDQPFNRAPRRYEDPDEYLVIPDPHPADWSRHGHGAGPIRNQEMVNTRPDMCYAFPTPKAKGTLDCMARCWVHGIPVAVWSHVELGSYRMLTDSEGEKLARSRLGWGR